MLSHSQKHSAMKQIVINVADERVPLYRELVSQLGDKVASEKQVDDEHVDVFERARLALRILKASKSLFANRKPSYRMGEKALFMIIKKV